MWSAFKETIFQYPTLSLVGFLAGFGWLGYYIVTKYLMNKQIKGFFPKSIFTVTFMCSLGLLLMYLYEIFHLQISEMYWDFILAILVVMCVIVTPGCLLLRLPEIYVFHFKNYKVPLLPVLIMCIYINLLVGWSMHYKEVKKIDAMEIFSKSILNILAEISVNAGVYIMALMSAYGSVWTPYIYFNHFDTMKSQLKEAKKKAKEEINFIVDQIKNNKYDYLLLEEKQQRIQQCLKERSSQNPQPQQYDSLLFRGIKSLSSMMSTSKNQFTEELRKIKEKKNYHEKQLETLTRVHQQSFSVYREIIDQERKHDLSETWIGKIFKMTSFVLCVYSLTKIVLTAWNMIVGRKLSTDPITRFMTWVTWVSESNLSSDMRLYSQYISFIFMGYLMISNVRSFSMNIKNFSDFIFRRRKMNIIAPETLVLLLSEMYGIYFLTAAILLQSGLPRTYVTNFQQITGKVLLVEHFTLFDKLYFWCCLLSAGFIFICEYQRKQKMEFIMKQRNLL